MLGRAKPTSSAASASRKSARPGVAAPGARAADDAREHVEVRVADGVLARPPLEPAVGEHEQRQQQQSEQQQRSREAQLGPRTQIAWICSSTRTSGGRVIPERTLTTTRLPARRGVARTEPSALSAGGLFWRKATARRVREQPLAREAGVVRALARSLSFRRTFLTRRIVASTTGPGAAAVSFRFGSYDVLRAAAAAAGGDAAEQRPEARQRARRPRDEDGRAVRRHAGADRAAESAEERELERAGAVGVEAADHLAAAGARELVVGRRRRRPVTCTHGPLTGMQTIRPVALRARTRGGGPKPATAAAIASTSSTRFTAASRRGRRRPRRRRAAGTLRPRRTPP